MANDSNSLVHAKWICGIFKRKKQFDYSQKAWNLKYKHGNRTF